MAFVVEDGTGLSDANAYITVQEYKDYHSDYGNADYDPLDDALIKQYILNATQYMDGEYIGRYGGQKTKFEQALLFPRAWLEDEDGYTVNSDEVPLKVKQACCEFSYLYKTQGFIYQDIDKDSFIEELKLDTMEVVYSEDSLNYPSRLIKTYTKADSLLKAYLGGGVGGITAWRG